ncbi:mitochondrial transcription rescue factor 1-like [Ciona intestinalis]
MLVRLLSKSKLVIHSVSFIPTTTTTTLLHLQRIKTRRFYSLSRLTTQCISCCDTQRVQCMRKASFWNTDDNDDDDVIINKQPTFPPNLHHRGYKDHRVMVDSARLLKVLRQAFQLSAQEAKNLFFSANLRLNHERVVKRSTKVKTGDVVDIVLEVTECEVKVKRIEIMGVEKTDDARLGIWVRKWRFLKLERKK